MKKYLSFLWQILKCLFTGCWNEVKELFIEMYYECKEFLWSWWVFLSQMVKLPFWCLKGFFNQFRTFWTSLKNGPQPKKTTKKAKKSKKKK